ncbi:type I-E CRISPR-associated protein Cse2/CasB [Cellulomonas bogoriensis]|uniref:CRISPR-associated protein Cse2 n=1 Tax=Cellulomonas bogoriensis 69B4 = DSM 16987 TaxID=1386082 RepID=A0A0A0BZ14_9CELL|nr:type I-E CRISPR-associated protein Cse2/CasB [Cellulomonas bogoriensis]KGM13638.1 CRISPR-associated protein Cse2 [Cellulomonas bogoriensis 69B4 = DSM 16987]
MTAGEHGAEGGSVSTRDFVTRQVGRIQAGYMRRPQQPWARAALAQLRRGVGREVGAVPEILELTVNPGAPVSGSEAPTPEENAIHLALTLYAVHQQSQSSPMHVPGVSFGTAVGSIRFRDGRENPGVVRRFQAMGTSVGLGEAAHHARTLVALLRSAGRGLDYGRFAEDLAAFQLPWRADGVRLQWGRDFYRVSPAPSITTSPTEDLS